MVAWDIAFVFVRESFYQQVIQSISLIHVWMGGKNTF